MININNKNLSLTIFILSLFPQCRERRTIRMEKGLRPTGPNHFWGAGSSCNSGSCESEGLAVTFEVVAKIVAHLNPTDNNQPRIIYERCGGVMSGGAARNLCCRSVSPSLSPLGPSRFLAGCHAKQTWELQRCWCCQKTGFSKNRPWGNT